MDTRFSFVLWWNGITENVIIYGPDDTVPSGITPIIVTFAVDASLASNTYGETIPNGVTPTELRSLSSSQYFALYTSNWNSVTIYLNGRTGDNNPFNYISNEADRATQINKVICHEMGHALKLAHPSEENDDGLRHTFAGCRGDYAGQESGYAIMNQGRFNDTVDRKLTASMPQDHDKINLTSKWEYHIDCSH